MKGLEKYENRVCEQDVNSVNSPFLLLMQYSDSTNNQEHMDKSMSYRFDLKNTIFSKDLHSSFPRVEANSQLCHFFLQRVKLEAYWVPE